MDPENAQIPAKPFTLDNLGEVIRRFSIEDGKAIPFVVPNAIVVSPPVEIMLLALDRADMRKDLIGDRIRLLGRRPNPGVALLAALEATSCWPHELRSALGRPRRVLDRWLHRLQSKGLIGYRRDIGYFRTLE